MEDCRYCTNYHLNSHERIDDCCLGKSDCRMEYFTCNENLKPKDKNDNKKNKKTR